MEGKRYPSDMTDEEWAILEPLIPDSRSGGRPRSANMHEVMNGIFYVLRGGIPWRFLPKEFPPWKTVYPYFRLWRDERQIAGAGAEAVGPRNHPQCWGNG
jgi:putative transposase